MKKITRKLTVLLTFCALALPISGYSMDNHQVQSNLYASNSKCSCDNP